MHRPCCLQAASSVLYTTSSSAPEDGRNYRPKHVELIIIINKNLLLLHLVGCLYYCIKLNSNFMDSFFEKCSNINFFENPSSEGAELFHADRQTLKKPKVVFCNFVNACKTVYYSRNSPNNNRYKTQQTFTEWQNWTELQNRGYLNPAVWEGLPCSQITQFPHLFGICLTTLSVSRAKQRRWWDDWWTTNWIKFEKKRSWPTVGTVIDSEYISDIGSGSTVRLHRYMLMYSRYKYVGPKCSCVFCVRVAIFNCVLCGRKKCEVLLLNAMEAYRGSGGIDPFILNLGTRRRRVVNFAPRLLYSQHPLNRRLGGPQGPPWLWGEYNCLPHWHWSPRLPGPLITVKYIDYTRLSGQSCAQMRLQVRHRLNT